jgi:hypothetical protein
MKNALKSILACLVLSWLAMGVLAQQDADRLPDDYKRSATLFSTYYQKLNSAYAFKGHEDEYLELWDTWKTELDVLRTDLKERYGETAEVIVAKFKDVPAPEGVGNSMSQIVGDLLPFDVAAKEKEIASWCVASGDEAYGKWKNFTAPETTKLELKVDYGQRALKTYRRAAAIDTEGDYSEAIDRAVKAVAESEKTWKAALKDLEWPGHNAEFEGPGDPDKLARQALELLASLDSWSKPEYDDEHVPIAACVTAKGWAVNKTTPITKVPTQYALNVFVAFQGTQDPDIAYAYHMVFYTKEEEGVAKQPPFRYANSRQYAKYKMLMTNVPKMVKVKKTRDGKVAVEDAGDGGASGGLFGWVSRLALSLLLLAVGCAGTDVAEKLKVPALAAVITKLRSKLETLGVAALTVGALLFLRTTLLHLAPLADIVPQLAAMAMGLLLGQGSLPPALKEKLRPVVARLDGLQKQLGLACLALGVLHLVLGGIILV